MCTFNPTHLQEPSFSIMLRGRRGPAPFAADREEDLSLSVPEARSREEPSIRLLLDPYEHVHQVEPAPHVRAAKGPVVTLRGHHHRNNHMDL